MALAQNGRYQACSDTTFQHSSLQKAWHAAFAESLDDHVCFIGVTHIFYRGPRVKFGCIVREYILAALGVVLACACIACISFGCIGNGNGILFNCQFLAVNEFVSDRGQ